MKGKDSDVRLQNRRVLGAGVSALGAALVLAGCGAGQITQTDTQQPAVNGTYAQVKTIVLRNVAVQYPAQGPGYAAGSPAPLTLTVINQGQKDDKLVSVTSEGSSGPAQISGDTAIVAGHSLVIGPADAVEQGAPAQSESANSTPASEANQPAAWRARLRPEQLGELGPQLGVEHAAGGRERRRGEPARHRQGRAAGPQAAAVAGRDDQGHLHLPERRPDRGRAAGGRARARGLLTASPRFLSVSADSLAAW